MPRVAYATATDGVLALGDPKRRHLLLTPAGVTHRSPDGDRVVPWAEVGELVVRAPRSRFRFPGAVRAAGAMLLATIGMDDVPATADLEARLTTTEGTETLPCDGFVGNGYWEPCATVLTALTLLVSTEPDARKALAVPERLLSVVAKIARPGVTPGAAVRSLRQELVAA